MTHPTNTAILSDDEINAIGHGKDWGMAWCVAFARQVERAIIERLGASDAVPVGYFCDWGDSEFGQRIAMYWGEPGSATVDDWNEYPKVHCNVAVYDATALAQATERGRQQGREEARAEFEPDALRYRCLRETTNWASGSDGNRIDVRNQPEIWDSAIDDMIADAARQPTQKDEA